MTSLSDKSERANNLRKEGDFVAAIPLYQELYAINPDKYNLSGLINCYRKTGRFNEAKSLAEEVFNKYPDFKWGRNEYVWTLIQGQLNNFSETDSLDDLIVIVNNIIKAKPETISLNYTIFKLLKFAKKNKNWLVLNDWITLIDPDTLEQENEGWSQAELWYYYRVEALINLKREDQAISIITENSNKIARKAVFFERLKAIAYMQLGDNENADKSYIKAMSFSRNVDWWLLHEYGTLLRKQNKKEEALSYMIKAATSKPMFTPKKLTLYSNIAELFIDQNNDDYAYIHLLLVKNIREENGWSLNDINDKLRLLNPSHSFEGITTKELERKCKNIWDNIPPHSSFDNPQRRITGKIISLYDDKTFCFIETKEKESFFCNKRDLPEGSKSGQIVVFSLKPSFDKKKNKESFSATNIRIKKETVI